MTERYDLILEAAHFSPNGQLEFARLYERRGPSYSDRVIFTREMLIEALKKNKKAAIGTRVKREASTFEIQSPVYLSSLSSPEVLVTTDGSSESTDSLPGLPYI